MKTYAEILKRKNELKTQKIKKMNTKESVIDLQKNPNAFSISETFHIDVNGRFNCNSANSFEEQTARKDLTEDEIIACQNFLADVVRKYSKMSPEYREYSKMMMSNQYPLYTM